MNDGTRTYTEVNTLLEPANNSSALQHDLEEIREVSTQLSQIKKKHDETKRVCIAKQEEIDQILKEIDNINLQEERSIGPTYAIKSRLDQLKEQYSDTCHKIDEEVLTQATYKYV